MERLTRRLLLGWALYGALTLATVLLLLWYRGVFLPCRSSRTAQAELGGRPCTLTLENGEDPADSLNLTDGKYIWLPYQRVTLRELEAGSGKV